MATAKDKFTFKIILSYLVLGTISVLVGFLLLSEFEKLTSESVKSEGEKKFVETGTLINLVYQADGFSRLALLTEDDSDFERYMLKTDSLFLKIKEIKSLSTNDFQLKQLDSVKSLLIEKNQNIEQLRILTLTNKKDTSLDEIMEEVQKLEASIGLISVETLYKNPSNLTARERKVWQAYADYLNSSPARETSMVQSKTVDSMLTAARYIVSEAKKQNSRIGESLRQKENELILNDLKISERLREIVASFDAEIARNNNLETTLRASTIERTGQIFKFAGILGGSVILIFSYFILSDFFKAERFKQNLEESKNYAETLLKSREQLISTVSHDLKTPLNTIAGYAELFENSPASDKQKYYLQQITSSSHFISQLVDDLLDYSKLEAGKLPVESIPFSLKNIVTDAGNAVKQSYPNKNVDLKVSTSKSIQNAIFESDPIRIRQIVNNLVGNAFKFTEEGTVSIEVRELKNKGPISTVEIAVIDTGIGISKEKQEVIFNEFTQAEADTAHKFGGSGLGLAISKKLTLLLGGTLKVESDLGTGSRFILTLPLKKTDRQINKQPIKKTNTFNSLRAVVIDDDRAMRSLMKEILERMQIPTTVFESYEDFKPATYDTNLNFDFILTDIQMPETDGFTILKNLQQGEIRVYKNQPVIAMTGSRQHNRDFFFEKGFSEILRKPFSREKLVEVLAQIFPNQEFNQNGEKIHPKSDDPSEKTIDHGKYNLELLKSFLDTPEALGEVLDVFSFQTETDLQHIREALAKNDVSTIKQTAHRMLTMFRQVQAVEVIPILEKMEEYSIENEKSETLKIDFENLTLKIKDLQKALEVR